MTEKTCGVCQGGDHASWCPLGGTDKDLPSGERTYVALENTADPMTEAELSRYHADYTPIDPAQKGDLTSVELTDGWLPAETPR